MEWSTDAGEWERDIESHRPLTATVSEFKDHATLWVDSDGVEPKAVFYAHAKPNSVAVEIDQNGSKLEVNP